MYLTPFDSQYSFLYNQLNKLPCSVNAIAEILKIELDADNLSDYER